MSCWKFLIPAYIQIFTHVVLSTNSITQNLQPDCMGSNLGSATYYLSMLQFLHLSNRNKNSNNLIKWLNDCKQSVSDGARHSKKKKSLIPISQKQGGVGQMVLGKEHSPISWKVTVVFSAFLKFQAKES